MRVKIGDTKQGCVVGQAEHGWMISVDGEVVYAKSDLHLCRGDKVTLTFKSFGVGCYWEVAAAGSTLFPEAM